MGEWNPASALKGKDTSDFRTATSARLDHKNLGDFRKVAGFFSILAVGERVGIEPTKHGFADGSLVHGHRRRDQPHPSSAASLSSRSQFSRDSFPIALQSAESAIIFGGRAQCRESARLRYRQLRSSLLTDKRVT
jgi:hypothetical protein